MYDGNEQRTSNERATNVVRLEFAFGIWWKCVDLGDYFEFESHDARRDVAAIEPPSETRCSYGGGWPVQDTGYRIASAGYSGWFIKAVPGESG